jgi:hypothetical protein
MPMRVQRTEGGVVASSSRFERLPVELYFRASFDEESTARSWAERMVQLLNDALPRLSKFDHTQVVVWAPRRRERGVRRSGFGYVYLSELTVRTLRAVTELRQPLEVISLSGLDYELEMLMGSEIDQQAYQASRRD